MQIIICKAKWHWHFVHVSMCSVNRRLSSDEIKLRAWPSLHPQEREHTLFPTVLQMEPPWQWTCAHVSDKDSEVTCGTRSTVRLHVEVRGSDALAWSVLHHNVKPGTIRTSQWYGQAAVACCGPADVPLHFETSLVKEVERVSSCDITELHPHNDIKRSGFVGLLCGRQEAHCCCCCFLCR